MDLKYNNIMYDDDHKVPIIIDFGLSNEIEGLKMDNYRTQKGNPLFGVMATWYPPWCIEIVWLSYIAVFIQSGDTKDRVGVDNIIDEKGLDKMNSIVKKLTKDNGLMQILNEDEKDKYVIILKEWINDFVGKTWGKLWDALVDTSKSWDNYGLASIYLMELNHITGLINSKTNEDFVKQYVVELNK